MKFLVYFERNVNLMEEGDPGVVVCLHGSSDKLTAISVDD